MNSGSSLSEIYKIRRNLYNENSIYLKGVFFKYEASYYPIKIGLSTTFITEKLSPLKFFDYDDFIFVNGVLIDQNNPFESIIYDLVNHKLSFLHFSTITKPNLQNFLQNIPELSAFERKIEENRETALEQLGHYMSLTPQEFSIIKENCSYPLLSFKQYPSKTNIFSLKINNNIQTAFNEKLRHQEPLIPIDRKNSLFPDYYSAVKYYFGKENLLLNNWSVVLSNPDFRARINKIIIKQDRVEIDIYKNIAKLDIEVKYYLEYYSGKQIADNFIYPECNYIPVDTNLIKLYIWIFDKNDPKNIIDYRKYDWGTLFQFQDPLAEYLKTEYETFNFNLMFSGESKTVEYKVDLDKNNGNKEFLETVCSFSNSDNGGYIFIGIDDYMNCKGIETRKIKGYKQSIENSIRDNMDPQPVDFEINERDYNGKKILEVHVYGGKSKPYCVKDRGYFIRVNGTDRIPTHNEIISLMPKEDNFQ